jgi:hypothetical protein
VAFYRSAATAADPDIWGHVKMGEHMLQTGELTPDTDTYSYLNGDYRVIDHEWLTRIVVAGVFRVGGPTGLVVFKLVLSLGTLGLLYRHLCRQGLDAMRAGLIILLVTFLCLPTFSRVSVGLFTFLFYTILLLLLRRIEQGERRWLLAIPPLMALWINLHPGVIAALGSLVVWSAMHVVLAVLRGPRPAARRSGPELLFVLTTLASGLATLLNPYGLRVPILLCQRALGSRTEVTEFLPVHIASADGIGYLALLAIAAVGIVGSHRPRSLPLLAVFGCTALTPLLAVRHMFLFAVAAVVIAGEHSANVWLRWSPVREGSPRFEKLLPIPLFLLSGLAIALVIPELRCIRLGPEVKQPYPSRAVAFLKDSGVHGNMVVFFDWGEYVFWHLAPDVRVSIDGRREVVYPEYLEQLNFQFLHGGGNWDMLLDMGPADLVLVPQSTARDRAFAAYNLMKLNPGWKPVYEDSLCAIFARAGSPLAEQLRRTTRREDVPVDGAGRCFPDDF